MNEMLKKLPAFVGAALSSNGSPSASRIAFWVFVAAGTVWLSYALIRHGLTPDWNMAFGLYGGACTGGYLGGKKIGAQGANDTPPAAP